MSEAVEYCLFCPDFICMQPGDWATWFQAAVSVIAALVTLLAVFVALKAPAIEARHRQAEAEAHRSKLVVGLRARLLLDSQAALATAIRCRVVLKSLPSNSIPQDFAEDLQGIETPSVLVVDEALRDIGNLNPPSATQLVRLAECLYNFRDRLHGAKSTLTDGMDVMLVSQGRTSGVSIPDVISPVQSAIDELEAAIKSMIAFIKTGGMT